MKKKLKFCLSVLAVLIFFSSCDENEIHKASTVENDPMLMIGEVVNRKASQQELQSIPEPDANTYRIGCALSDDVQCGEASSEAAYYIENCSVYPKSWPPSGDVTQFYKGFSFYMDSDDDVSMDIYEDDLQDHVDEIIASTGSVSYIDAQIIYWPCSKGYNAAVILYTVYK
ncbi:hypothetical protein LVD15_08600 [Fulvivirga maritima]|uniref:hypothetical protein n=1 Tax=Fulvivirga maritima TaxID=2904247 RepID=UPI001F1B8B68|nr:hypothetical protein [Fulvivirga maritima]UII28474.1 hypothetical protein LVD15_08600 [Fulvivirga maritima]